MKKSTAAVVVKAGEVKAAVDTVEVKVGELKTAAESAVKSEVDLPQVYADIVIAARELLAWTEKYFKVLPPTKNFRTEYDSLKARIEAKL